MKFVYKIRKKYFVFVLQCIQREMFKIKIEDGREEP